MTIAEYARWCGENSSGATDELLGATWGEFADRLQILADEYRGIEDQIPDEASLLTFHRASRGGLQALIEFARQQDEDEVYNPFALLVPATVAGSSIEAAEARLTLSIRTELVSAGCIDEQDESTGQQQDDQPTSTALNDIVIFNQG